MAVTRIKNNQILDSGIWANSKIIPGSITGSLFNSNITVTSDFTITGNLYVQGAASYTTIASTNTYVNDPLIVLNNAFSGANTNDIGLIFERGDSNNQAFYWDESSDTFKLITTSEDGTTYGDISAESAYSNLNLGNLVAQYDVQTISVTATGLINTTGNISGAVVNAGALNTTGTLTAAQLNTSGNVLAAGAVLNALTVNGDTTVNGDVSGGLADFAAINGTPIGNATASTGAFTSVTATGLINTTGNISGAVVNAGAINSTGLINTTGNVTAAVVDAGAINSTGLINTTGNISAATVNTATLAATDLTSGRVTFATTGGALTDNAGLTFSGNVLDVGGQIQVDGDNATISTVSDDTDLVLAPNGTGVVDFNATTASNLADPTSNQDAVTLAYFNSQISSGVTNIQLDDTDVTINDLGSSNESLTSNVNAILMYEATSTTFSFKRQVEFANGVASTSTTTGDVVVSGGVGVGGNVVAGEQFKSTADWESSSTTTGAIITAGGVGIARNLNVGGDVTITGDLTVQGDTTTLNTATLTVEDLNIVVADGAGSSAAADGAGLTVDTGIASISYSHATTSWDFDVAVIATAGTEATDSESGALQVQGGAGITGALYVGSGIQGTPIGNATASSGAFTSLTASGYTNLAGNLSASDAHFASVNSTGFINTSGNVSAAVVNGGAINSTGLINTTGNISGAVVNAGTLTTTGTLTAAQINTSGNVLAAGAVLNDLTVNGDATVTGDASLGLTEAAAINNTPIGNATPSTGAFTSVTATGLINTTGNVSAATVNAADVTATGTVTAGQFNTSGNVLATGGVYNALTVNGDATVTGDVSGGLADFAAINSTPVGNATPSTGAFTDLSATGTAYANATTDTSSLTTGALITAGGAAVTKSMYVGNGLTLNSSGGANDLVMSGQGNAGALVKVDASENAIVFSDRANATVQSGTIAKFDSTGAILLPVGANGDRPGSAGNVDVAGMFRYSTTASGIEYYDGSEWVQPGTEFTVITADSFSGDGSTTDFTLSSASTTAATVVAINGIVQIPTTAYSVSGTTLSFTEAPETGDVIDARLLTTTTTIVEISNSAGTVNFKAEDSNYANVTTNSTVQISVDNAGTVTFTNDVVINGELTVLGDSSGNINIGNEAGDRTQLRGDVVYDATVTNAPSGNMVAVDTFESASYRSAKYIMQVRNGDDIELNEVLVAHDTSTADTVTYGGAGTDTLGTFASNIAGGTVSVWFVPTDGTINPNVKVMTTYIV